MCRATWCQPRAVVDGAPPVWNRGPSIRKKILLTGGRLFGEGVPLMLATWMRFWLLPSRVSCVLLYPSLLLLLLLCCILLLLVDLT